jgi:hypothetical protein
MALRKLSGAKKLEVKKSRDTVPVREPYKNKYELTCISVPILTVHFTFVWFYTPTFILTFSIKFVYILDN